MTLDKIQVIAKTTFKEIWKSKILVNVFLIGVAMMVVTFVATEFSVISNKVNLSNLETVPAARHLLINRKLDVGFSPDEHLRFGSMK